MLRPAICKMTFLWFEQNNLPFFIKMNFCNIDRFKKVPSKPKHVFVDQWILLL